MHESCIAAKGPLVLQKVILAPGYNRDYKWRCLFNEVFMELDQSL